MASLASPPDLSLRSVWASTLNGAYSTSTPSRASPKSPVFIESSERSVPTVYVASRERLLSVERLWFLPIDQLALKSTFDESGRRSCDWRCPNESCRGLCQLGVSRRIGTNVS